MDTARFVGSLYQLHKLQHDCVDGLFWPVLVQKNSTVQLLKIKLILVQVTKFKIFEKDYASAKSCGRKNFFKALG